MIFALVKDGFVSNVIVLGESDDSSALPPLFGVDEAVNVTAWQPQRPGPGWLWDGQAFTPPPPAEPETEPEA